MQISLINGQPGHLDLSHRALSYGDGIFETVLILSGQPMLFDAHLVRLEKGVSTLGLSWSREQRENLINQVERLTLELKDPHVLKIMLIRNAPGRGYAYEPDRQRTDVLMFIEPYSAPAWCKEGIHTCSADTPITENAYLAGLKHLNRLDSVLARAEYPKSDIQEVFLLDSDGNVVEGSMSNVLVRLDDRWLTPVIKRSGVRGVVRDRLLACGFIEEGYISESQMQSAQSAMICGSLIGIVPILSYNQRKLDVHPDADHMKKQLGFPW